jgi:ribosomal protein S18 acetylase RimI-like enzyme
MVLDMMPDHIPQVVAVHMISFKGFFLTFLGDRFLRIYYSSIVKDNDSVALVYIDAGMVVGFVVGFINPSAVYSRLLKKNWYRFGIASLPALLKKPQCLFRIFRGSAKPKETPKGTEFAELASIAVLPGKQNRGIGKALHEMFVRKLAMRQVKFLYLLTDARNNDPVNNFYLTHGFALRNTFETAEGRLMNEYWYNIQ